MNQLRSATSRVLVAATEAGDDVLITDDHRAVTGIEFVAAVQHAARVLADLGYDRRHTVAVAAGVTIDALVVRHAANLAGCATVFCPEAPHRFAPFVAMAQADVVLVGPRQAATAPQTVPRLLVGTGGDLDPLRAGTDDRPVDTFEDRARPEDVAVLVSSGGTTGQPKASRRTFAGYLGLVTGPTDPARRQLVCTPLANVAQVHADQTLLAGGRLFLQDDFDPAAVLGAIEQRRITHLGLVEPLVARLAAHPDRARRDLGSLVSLVHIGASAPARLRHRWLDAFGPVLVNPYGSSECGIATVLTAPAYGCGDDAMLASAGRVLPGAEVRIERPDGSRAATDEVGRLVVRTTGVAVGYAGQADQDDAFRADGWFASGDLASVSDEGYLTIRGRMADERVVDGRSLLPIDLESALYAHPLVRYAAALPLDTDTDLPFGAVVTLARGARVTAAELSGWVAREDPALAPAALAVLDQMPVTEQGKPDRAVIAELLTVRAQAA